MEFFKNLVEYDNLHKFGVRGDGLIAYTTVSTRDYKLMIEMSCIEEVDEYIKNLLLLIEPQSEFIMTIEGGEERYFIPQYDIVYYYVNHLERIKNESMLPD